MTATQTSAASKPIPFALVMGTSFIGIWWLLEPLFAHLGWSRDVSRAHLLFVGAVYAIGITWLVRARASSAFWIDSLGFSRDVGAATHVVLTKRR